jgi:hypothetical protein
MDALEHGDPIPGSRYFRAFCNRCRTPLRVTEARLGEENFCEECSPRKPPPAHTGLIYPQKVKLSKTDGG